MAVLLVVYDRVADLSGLHATAAAAHARTLWGLERALHLAPERTAVAHVVGHPLLVQAASLYYDFAHVLVMLTALIGVYVLRPASYVQARRSLLALNVVALACFLLYPVAPPRLLTGAGFVDVVASSHTWGAWAASATLAKHANEYASMPSLHIGWALWVLLTVRAASASLWLRRLAAAHVLLTAAVVLGTGNHWLVDIVIGALLTVACWEGVAAGVLVGVRPDTAGGVLVVSASMGAGHDGVANELARRWRAQGTPVTVVDFLSILPFGVGRVLKSGYSVQLNHAPASYDWMYDALDRMPLLDRVTEMVSGWGRRRLARQARRGRYRLAVATYPLAGRALGQLRREGRLPIPAVTFLTDVDVHATWLDADTDLYLAVYDGSARCATARTGRPARATGPVLPPALSEPVSPAERSQARAGLAAEAPIVLVATGSWGVGSVRSAVLALRDAGTLPVVMCGRNEGLRRSLDLPGIRALGWTSDVRSLYAAADVVVHNAGGLSSLEAFAAGVPVIGHGCLPGHGQRNARAMAEAGVAALAADEADLVRLVGELAGTAAGHAMAARARSLFADDIVAVLDGVTALPRTGVRRRRRLRVAAVLTAFPVALSLTSLGVSEATERGLAVARPSHAAADAVYVGVLLDAVELTDPATPRLLARSAASAVVPPKLAEAYPASVRALASAHVAVLAAFPRLPRSPESARRVEASARADVARASGEALPPVVSLHGLGAWSLMTAYSEHLRLGVATPLTGRAPTLHSGQQLVLDVGADRLARLLTDLSAQAHRSGLPVRPLGDLWAG